VTHVSPLRSLAGPAVATLLAAVAIVGLGIWQLERHTWKEDLLARIDARIHAPAAEIPPETRWPNWSPGEDEYRHVSVKGEFEFDREVLVHGNSPRDQRGIVLAGYAVLTPLRRPDGSFVIVNRGFIPMEMRERPDLVQRPQGEVTVTGIARASQTRGWFVPDDEPARGEWFTRDIEAIARDKGLSRVAPFIVDADATPEGQWPKGGLTVVSFPNNHLEYAFTWFGIAATLVGVFSVFAWRRLKSPPP
jgi:surfeit locus 1 family protein